ncbi:MAG: carbon-nitrogen hydrolase family protein [Proteobacteria bacterium]|nr:carbon-nitrogen hydrolase family protein [Pseudomonadota bacterium]
MSRVAVAQAAPVWLDRASATAQAVKSIEQAAAGGAELVMFPEAYLPGYPTWIWRLRPGGDMALTTDIHRRLIDNAVDLSKGHLDPLRDAARKHGVVVSVGMTERDSEYSRGTLFNANTLIGPDGEVLNHYRKMMPTNPERMVWGMGNASGLKVVETPVGRVGVLICWGNFMPLARYTLYSQGLEILLSPTWDAGEGWLGSMRHIAREGRCWVVSAATAAQNKDIPADFPGRGQLFSDDGEEWINPGDAVVVKPGGEVVAGPHHRQRGLLFAEVDASEVAVARRSLDVAGHYSRSDIFQLTVRDGANPPISSKD